MQNAEPRRESSGKNMQKAECRRESSGKHSNNIMQNAEELESSGKHIIQNAEEYNMTSKNAEAEAKQIEVARAENTEEDQAANVFSTKRVEVANAECGSRNIERRSVPSREQRT